MAGRHEQRAREATRRERAAAARRAQQAGERRRRLLGWGAAALAAVVVLGGITAAVLLRGTGKSLLSGVRSYSEVRNHVPGKVSYPQTPPAGGNHNAVWLNCGIYDQPVANENAVHDLEHGAVWITYRPDLPAAQVSTLRNIVRGQTYLTLSPYPGIPAPVVASAWGKQLSLTGAADKRLPAFTAKYRQSPQAPEPGASCTDGTGTPTS